MIIKKSTIRLMNIIIINNHVRRAFTFMYVHVYLYFLFYFLFNSQNMKMKQKKKVHVHVYNMYVHTCTCRNWRGRSKDFYRSKKRPEQVSHLILYLCTSIPRLIIQCIYVHVHCISGALVYLHNALG